MSQSHVFLALVAISAAALAWTVFSVGQSALEYFGTLSRKGRIKATLALAAASLLALAVIPATVVQAFKDTGPFSDQQICTAALTKEIGRHPQFLHSSGGWLIYQGYYEKGRLRCSVGMTGVTWQMLNVLTSNYIDFSDNKIDYTVQGEVLTINRQLLDGTSDSTQYKL